MKNTLILASFILIFFSGLSQIQEKPVLNTFLQKIERSSFLMGNVSISKNGEEIYQYSLGFRNIDEKLKNTAQTKFRIGSLSKSFTAIMIMQLVEEEKISLDEKLAVYLSEVPNSDKISIEQLLKHQSGLFNITQSNDFFTWMESFHSQNEIMNLIVMNGTVFEPGEKTQYSNTNFILLSYILEQIEKKDYSEILADRITIPCELENTYYGGDINSKENEAFSYVKVNDTWKNSTMTDMSVPLGAGAIVSTPADLNLFYFQLFTGNLLDQSSIEIMTANKNLYEFALYPVISYDSKDCFGHEGHIDGFHAFSAYFPEDSISISFCSNGDYGYLDEVILQTLYYFYNPDNNIGNIFVNDNNKIEVLKVNDCLLVKMNEEQYLFLEKTNEHTYKSEEDEIVIKIKGDHSLKLKDKKGKRILIKE